MDLKYLDFKKINDLLFIIFLI